VSATPTAGTRVAGRYRLQTRIGSGGAGIVWRAWDEVLERAVAVKLLRPELASDAAAVSRFLAEASSAAKLNHPNAVVVYDVGREGDRDLLVMELVEGPTLADLLARAPLPAGVVAHLGRGVAGALGAAHARGLVHRDVKPANVLLARDGTPKVADFGIARALGEATSRLTLPGTVMGTARYLSPEQLRDEPVDARSDVYAVGLLLAQALTGDEPFGSGTAAEIAARRLTNELPPPASVNPEVPSLLDRVVTRATRREPDERHHDGTELAIALGPCVSPGADAELGRLVRGIAAAGPTEEPSSSVPAPAPARRRDDVAPTAVGRAAVEPPGAARPTPEEIDRTTALRATPSRPAGVDATRAQRAAPSPAPAARPARPAPAPRSGSTTAAAARPERRRRRRRRLATTLVVLLAVLGAGWWAATGGLTGVLEDGFAADPEPVTVVASGDHDPLGDLREHPDRVPDAFDGDPTTAWTTERYDRADLIPPAKDGVGLWFELDRSVDAATVEVTLGLVGTSVELYAGQGPPDEQQDPRDWGELVAATTDAGTAWTAEVEADGADVLLLWFTELGAADDGFRATVGDVRIDAG
jgi:hypothetical protein